jgi:hypothetical protein
MHTSQYLGIQHEMREKREAVRRSLDEYERTLHRALEGTPRGSGHATNEFDHLQASITQVGSAKRVLWMD